MVTWPKVRPPSVDLATKMDEARPTAGMERWKAMPAK